MARKAAGRSAAVTAPAGKDGGLTIRPLTAADLDAVVAIDAALVGRPRRGFFERRLHAAVKDPKGFVYVGAAQGGVLRGFMLVRLITGEFGGAEEIAILDAMGVDPAARRHGVGRAMLADVDRVLRHKGVATMDTQTAWASRDLIGFLEAAGFAPGPRVVLARDVAGDIAW